MMNDTSESTHDLVLLEQIEQDPDITQASMATRLGVAVGTVNWHIKRLIAKGYVKVKRAERRKLRYIITPEGIAFRARLTVDYIEQSMLLYRNTRRRVSDLLVEVKRAGYDSVVIEGDGDIADVCRLTCMEHGIKVSASQSSPRMLPGLVVQGLEVGLRPAGKSLLQESTQP